MSEDELKVLENELKFSRNTVCLDLTGPELADLAFVDLPGAFICTALRGLLQYIYSFSNDSRYCGERR